MFLNVHGAGGRTPIGPIPQTFYERRWVDPIRKRIPWWKMG